MSYDSSQCMQRTRRLDGSSRRGAQLALVVRHFLCFAKRQDLWLSPEFAVNGRPIAELHCTRR